MNRSASIRPAFASLLLLSVAAWWGCAKASGDPTTSSTGGGTTSSASAGGGSDGGHPDGSADADAGMCVPTGTPTQHVPLDIVFLVDQGIDMHGVNWSTLLNVLPKFWNDPASAGVSAGLVFLPYSAWDCNLDHYKTLTVPIGALPANAAALTSVLPADSAGVGRPMYPALQGALMQATARKDAHPTHKVVVVLITNGDPLGCQAKIDDIAALAASALAYNGVQTHVVALPGGSIADLGKIALAGGTTAAHNATINIGLFSSSLADIRTAGLGCDYQIPTPPNSKPLVPDQVNVSYTPKGMGTPVVLLRAKDGDGCNGQPGWYFDDDGTPTKIVLCPASCATVQLDPAAEVDVLFGCDSQLN